MTSLTFSTFSAWVSIDGEKARVYGVDTSIADRVTGWIASEVDKPFEIFWKDSLVSFPTEGRVYIDGQYSGSKDLYKKRHVNKPTQRWGKRISTKEQRPYTFSRLATTDNDSVSDTLPPGFGNIELKISRTEREHLDDDIGGFTDLRPEMTFNERDKKGYDHQVKFGSPVKSRFKASKYASHLIGKPLVTFCFKYRPLDILQAEGIAPLPPQAPKREGRSTTTDASRSITLQEDDAEALETRARELQAESNEIQAKLEAIKKRKRPLGDFKGESRENSKRAKREYAAEWADVEVIDLT